MSRPLQQTGDKKVMQFKTTYRNRAVVVDISDWKDFKSLEGVEIVDQTTGDQIDYDTLGEIEWFRFWELCMAEHSALLADRAMTLRWD